MIEESVNMRHPKYWNAEQITKIQFFFLQNNECNKSLIFIAYFYTVDAAKESLKAVVSIDVL